MIITQIIPMLLAGTIWTGGPVCAAPLDPQAASTPGQEAEARRLSEYRPPNEVVPQILAAQEFIDEGREREAIASLRALLLTDDDPAARFLLANTLFNEGRHDSAAAEYRRVLRRFPRDLMVMSNLAKALWLAGDYTAARKNLARCVQEREKPELLDLLARCHIELGDLTSAVLVLERYLALDPENTDLRVQLARLQLMRGDAAEAARLAGEGLEAGMLEPRFLRILANARLREGDQVEARIVLEMLELTGQARPEEGRMLADLHLSGGSPSEAVRLYRRLIESDSGVLEDRRRLALALWKAQKLEEARDELVKLARELPRDAANWLFLGRVYVALGQNGDALAPLEKAAVFDPNSGDARVLRAQALFGLGRLDDAELAYREVIHIEGAEAQGLAGMGEVALARGRIAEALDDYRKAQAADPANTRIYDRFLILRKRYR